MSKTLNKCKQNKNDIIFTPIELAKECINLVPIAESDSLLDPFYGGGAFYDNYPEKNKKEWCEIEMGIDFFDYKGNVDWVISNPPFSLVNQILDKCVLVCNKGFGLILLCTALTAPRINRMKQMGFVISKVEIFQVKTWFGFPCLFILFEKNGKSLLTFETNSY